MKAFYGPTTILHLLLSLTTFEMGPIIQLEVVLDSKVIFQSSIPIPQVVVKWVGMDTQVIT